MNLLSNYPVSAATRIAAWDSPAAGAVSSWADSVGSKALAQATGGKQPVSASAIFGAGTGVKFDGVDDILTYAAQLTAVTNAGTIAVLFKTGTSVIGPMVLIGAADSGSANNWFEIGITSNGKLYVESNVGGTKQTVYGSSFLAASTAYLLILCWDGTDWVLYLQSDATASTSIVEENPLSIESIGAFAWIGSVSGTPTFSVGANAPNGTAARFFNGHIGSVYLWSNSIVG